MELLLTDAVFMFGCQPVEIHLETWLALSPYLQAQKRCYTSVVTFGDFEYHNGLPVVAHFPQTVYSTSALEVFCDKVIEANLEGMAIKDICDEFDVPPFELAVEMCEFLQLRNKWHLTWFGSRDTFETDVDVAATIAANWPRLLTRYPGISNHFSWKATKPQSEHMLSKIATRYSRVWPAQREYGAEKLPEIYSASDVFFCFTERQLDLNNAYKFVGFSVSFTKREANKFVTKSSIACRVRGQKGVYNVFAKVGDCYIAQIIPDGCCIRCHAENPQERTGFDKQFKICKYCFGKEMQRAVCGAINTGGPYKGLGCINLTSESMCDFHKKLVKSYRMRNEKRRYKGRKRQY